VATDFKDAHDRHFADANTLYHANRWANADHLYGLSAECGLKALMVSFGMQLQTNGAPNKSDKEHINKLLPRYEAYRSGHHEGINYPLSQTNPFTNWDVNQRYDSQVGFTQSAVDPHQQGAKCIKQLVMKAQLAGLL
jgi:hypothetical protein